MKQLSHQTHSKYLQNGTSIPNLLNLKGFHKMSKYDHSLSNAYFQFKTHGKEEICVYECLTIGTSKTYCCQVCLFFESDCISFDQLSWKDPVFKSTSKIMGAAGAWNCLRWVNFLYAHYQVYALEKHNCTVNESYSICYLIKTSSIMDSYTCVVYLAIKFNILHKYILDLHINYLGDLFCCIDHTIHTSRCQTIGMCIIGCSSLFIPLIFFILTTALSTSLLHAMLSWDLTFQSPHSL